MMDDGTQGGPMATWTHVAAVPGAQQVLRSLRPRYRLIVATNAADSGGDQVRAALARVGLDDLVDDVVTSREVGASKPDPAFFRAALRAASAGRPFSPRRAVMVGDSWKNDVAGALAAGLRAVRFNPSGGGRPCGAPAPDAEIVELLQLPPALDGLARDVRVGPAKSE
jgi:putative hydrolase of the HAD superfamily